MSKSHIYISVGWLSFALCICAVSSCLSFDRKYKAQEVKSALSNNYEEVVERHSGYQHVLWKKVKEVKNEKLTDN